MQKLLFLCCALSLANLLQGAQEQLKPCIKNGNSARLSTLARAQQFLQVAQLSPESPNLDTALDELLQKTRRKRVAFSSNLPKHIKTPKTAQERVSSRLAITEQEKKYAHTRAEFRQETIESMIESENLEAWQAEYVYQINKSEKSTNKAIHATTKIEEYKAHQPKLGLTSSQNCWALVSIGACAGTCLTVAALQHYTKYQLEK